MDKEIKISPGVEIEQFSESGLRDYFAAKAMQGLLANTDINTVNNRFSEYVKIIHDSYKIADEMMEARK